MTTMLRLSRGLSRPSARLLTPWKLQAARSRLAEFPGSSQHHLRFFSTDNNNKNNEIRILYGSQGGTAQVFGMQLQDALQSVQPNSKVKLLGLHECSDPKELVSSNATNIFLISVAGVGEPPDNAKAFYEYIMDNNNKINGDMSNLSYTVFGLGNQKAHPNHYNIIGKSLDARLSELGATRIFPLGLGDDGECIEDDFDVWMEALVTKLSTGGEQGEYEQKETETAAAPVLEEPETTATPPASPSSRRLSSKYPTVLLESPRSEVIRDNLFDIPQPFYAPDVRKMSIGNNRLLSVKSLEYGLRELTIALPHDASYEAGDHMIIYPRNPNCVVEAFLQLIDVDPHTVIAGVSDDTSSTSSSSSSSGPTRSYPFPTGITVMETLSHCIDLGAPPSPAFARMILGKQDIKYKEDIVNPRRTILDLAIEAQAKLSLEEWLYNLPPMQPRYYSIASSPLAHPHEVLLTYRPVKYMTSKGMLREGVCTSFMSSLGASDESPSQIAAALRSNPTFRLPQDPMAPVLLIAGGCGIAPIRAFLEERLALHEQGKVTSFGESHLFLGFRSPSDEVYQKMVQEAVDKQIITDAHVSYTAGCLSAEQNCRLVSDTLRINGKLVWDLFQRGGYAYLCGGARTFGAAIEREVLEVFQEQGKISMEEATKYLQTLIKEGRFCEDLAD